MKRSTLIIATAILIFSFSCKKDKNNEDNIPVLSTNLVSHVKSFTAIGGGNISSNGASSVTASGICWSTGQTPTTSDNKTTDGTSSGNFASIMTGLGAGTTYYVRAYATNNSGTGYGDAVTFTTNQSVTDIDGNIYGTVTIGTQVWMTENLRTTKYNNGTAIPKEENNSNWGSLTTPAYCWYNNDEAQYKNPYGALYNWYAVNTGNLCPTGWHVPSNTELNTLVNYLGSNAGAKLKESGTEHWVAPNTGATNETDFTALPGGVRYVWGSFGTFSTVGFWWSSTSTGNYAYYLLLLDDDVNADICSDYTKKGGMSIRCLKN